MLGFRKTFNPGVKAVPMCYLESSADKQVWFVCLLNFSNLSLHPVLENIKN